MGVVFEAPPGKVLQLDIDQLWMPPGMALHVYDGFDNLSPEVSTNIMQNRNLMDHVLSHMSGSCDRHWGRCQLESCSTKPSTPRLATSDWLLYIETTYSSDPAFPDPHQQVVVSGLKTSFYPSTMCVYNIIYKPMAIYCLLLMAQWCAADEYADRVLDSDRVQMLVVDAE